MRKLLSILAVLIGLMSALMAAGSSVFFVMTLVNCLKAGAAAWADLTPVYLLVITGCFAFLGFLIASRALLHVRKPDRGTATDIVGLATFLVGFELYGLFSGKSRVSRLWESWDPIVRSSLALAAVIAFYLFYRLVMKRIAERAYPEEVAPKSARSTTHLAGPQSR